MKMMSSRFNIDRNIRELKALIKGIAKGTFNEDFNLTSR